MSTFERQRSTSNWVQRHSLFRVSNSEPGFMLMRRKLQLDDNLPAMGRRVDVSQLTEEECSKILDVISKDILIRKSEKERISYTNKKFEELRRAIILSNSSRKKIFPLDACLICGKHLFTFCCFFRHAGECVSCESSCCSSCRKGFNLIDDEQEYYICNLCIHKRQMKGQTGEWYYAAADERFKRFGSAKALRAIYKQRASIQPRVITLLALCRELQPAQKISITSFTNRYSKQISKDYDKATFSSSFSDADVKDYDYNNKLSFRKRMHSESDLAEVKRAAINVESITKSLSMKENRDTRKVSRTHSFESLRKCDNALNHPVLKSAIAEHDEITEVKEVIETTFTEVDYLGLVSLILTMCFVMALLSCLGLVFDNGSGERKDKDEFFE